MEDLLKLLLISAVSFVACEESLDYPFKPDRCHVAPELLYRQCCLFPPFFTRDTAKSCGAFFQVLPPDPVSKFTGLRRIAPDMCTYWKCILKTYDLLSPDGTADIERYFVHLDKWVELNTLYSNVMSDAKVFCKQLHTIVLPLKYCEFQNLHRCIRNYIDVHCPMIINTGPCKEKREFFEECAEYYI